MVDNLIVKQSHIFVGRKAELEIVRSRLSSPECRLLTITGLGGSGKTRLALEATHDLAAQFSDGIFFVGLQQLSRSDLIILTIAQALNLAFYGEEGTELQLFKYLSDKSLLLLLDNFEHLLTGAPVLSTILAYAPNVKILVTSREALNLQEEWLYPLAGMSIPLSAYTSSLEDYDAVQLFLHHARRIQPTFDLEREREAIIRICGMTGGLPLAIELSASWLKGLTASQIATAMQNNLDFLSTKARNIEERHRSMRAVFEQSWTLLPENERWAFAKLSIFLGGFDAEAAQQIAGASLPILADLVEKSLIQMASSNRFLIHEMLRQFGLEKLAAYGETGSIYAQHSLYFSQWMRLQEVKLKQLEQMETMRSIEQDFENIRLAWEWALKNQLGTHLHTMLNSLYLFGFLGSRSVEIMGLFHHCLDRVKFDTSLHGRMLVRRWGFLHWWYRTDYSDALANIEQALSIAQAENNRFEIAFCHLTLAYALMGMARFTDAVGHLETSKELFGILDEPYYTCWVLHRLGTAYAFLNEPDTEVQYMEQSLALARRTNNRFALFLCLFYLGSDQFLRRNYLRGKHYGSEALQSAISMGQQCQISHAAGLVALIAFYEGDYDTCFEYAERSRIIVKDIISLLVQPYSLSLLVLLACRHEDYDEGVRLIELENQHYPNLLGFQLCYWARAALACGLGNPAEVRFYLQKVYQLSDRETQSALIFGLVPCAAYSLMETAPDKAVELLAWTNSHHDASLNWARQWPLVTRLQSELRTTMDGHIYQAHWDKGKSLTVEDVELYLQTEFGAQLDNASKAMNQQLLTVRESEILRLMSVGMTNPEIATELVIGAGTVKTHTLNIYRKLEVTNRTQAIMRAQELGILST